MTRRRGALHTEQENKAPVVLEEAVAEREFATVGCSFGTKELFRRYEVPDVRALVGCLDHLLSVLKVLRRSSCGPTIDVPQKIALSEHRGLGGLRGCTRGKCQRKKNQHATPRRRYRGHPAAIHLQSPHPSCSEHATRACRAQGALFRSENRLRICSKEIY